MRRPALVAGAGACVLAVAAFLAVRSLGPPSAGDAGSGPPVQVSTHASPRTVLFGDRVEARAAVVVDGRRADPERVRIAPDFAPFELLAAPERDRVDDGALVRLTYRFQLVCLRERCAPPARRDSRTIALPVFRARAPLHDGGTTAASAPWPELRIARRVSEDEAGGTPPPWRTEPLPEPSLRLGPGFLSAGLAALAALLLVAAALVTAGEVARRRRLLLEARGARTRLEQALELARESAARSPEDRRKALAQLARVLARRSNGGPALARSARALAWSRDEPSPARVEELVTEVERTVGER